MAQDRTVIRAAWASAVFAGIVILVLGLSMFELISFQMALLMLIGLLGLYVGMGVLVLVYRLTQRLH